MTSSLETGSQPLRLVALDDDDLAVLSANMQDALIPIAELAYLPGEKRFALAGKRFDWVKAAAGGCERRAVGMHFERVLGVARVGFTPTEAERVLNLLTVRFTPTASPAGHVTLTFSGGAAIRLEVECLEAQMRDLGPCWPCDKPASHPTEPDMPRRFGFVRASRK